MITLQIPLKIFTKINKSYKGQTIVCNTTSNQGVVDYICVLGLCREKNGRNITTVKQANVVLKLKTEEELIDAIRLYKPNNVCF